MKELLNILEEIKPGVDFKNSENMLEEGLIDSFDIINIVANISNVFNVYFTATEITPENFASVESLYNAIEKMKEK